jgi:thioredoxin-related protein
MDVITRRRFNHLAATGVLGATLGLSAGGPVVAAPPKPYTSQFTPKGLHSQPWFLNSFLDLKDDLESATNAGRRFAVMWELAGCPYCRETHLVNFARPDIRDYIKENYDFLQLDVRGAREVVDFDGTVMAERDLAKRHKIRFSPTIQFFPETADGVTGRDGKKTIEIARMPGYFRPRHFLAMFQYVRDKGYETGDYRSYLKARRKKRSG